MSDPNNIKAREDLVVNGICSEFKEADPTIVGNTPEKVVTYGSVALCAQHVGLDEKEVNLRMPAILKWLKTFAESGTGPAKEYESIRFKFIKSTLPQSCLSSGGRS